MPQIILTGLLLYAAAWIFCLKIQVWNLVHQLKEARDAP